MGITISPKFLNDLTTKLLKASQGGAKLDIDDPDEVGQFACSVLALGCELIPIAGSSLSALTTLLGSVLFSPNSTEKIWAKLRERIEVLIDSKIAENQLEILKKKIQGLQDNMDIYTQYVANYEDAKGQEQEKARDTLKSTHIAFLSVVRTAIPEFRLEHFAVASLPLFALAANIHLMLLSDGIKHGKAWGYSDNNIGTMRAEFKKRTSPETKDTEWAQRISEQSSALKEAISKGIEAGVPNKIVDTWKIAYDDLSGLDDSNYDDSSDDYSDLDYVSYAKKIYEKGRKEVKPYKAQLTEYENKGITIAATLSAYADYDTRMIMNVLNYAEYWPYLAGDKMPESVLRALDREIFFGPFGRYGTNIWSESSPAPIVNRSAGITAAYVRAWQSIDCVQIKYGDSWGNSYGDSNGGAAKQLDLEPDEYFNVVNARYGHKLGNVKLWTNKQRVLENGYASYATIEARAAPPGYRLTSVYITHWESHTPPGCEGIIFGFRPSLIESD